MQITFYFQNKNNILDPYPVEVATLTRATRTTLWYRGWMLEIRELAEIC